MITRRDLLKAAGAGALLTGLPMGWRGAVYAGDAPETPRVRIGIIALTDCSSIVMAHELGLFKKHGIESTISAWSPSWAPRSRIEPARRSCRRTEPAPATPEGIRALVRGDARNADA